MLKTIIFKFVLSIYFIIWTPFLGLSLINKKLTRIAMRVETMGVLFLARKIAGITYTIHYPPVE